ncbi:carbohydrate ABC transporter permease [Georgenia alba]|uniref:Carbohydrate ABC transporter permease n=1 Tax=Georgenia alba TaxID=2233858 RepID=A0ABW2Q9C8_9MICO
MKMTIGQRLLLGVLVALIVLVTLFPIYWVTISALRGYTGLFDHAATLWPTAADWTFYRNIWASTDYPRYYLNSVIVALVATAVTVVFSVSMGYALTRFRFRFNALIRTSMLVGYMLPPMVLAIPLLGMLVAVGLDDTLVGLVLAHVAMCLPFGVWMMISFMRTVPFDLEEAAWIDGASRSQALVRVIVPVITPGITSVAIFTFIVSFTDYVFGLMLISTDSRKTIPVGLATIAESTALQRGDLLAGAALIGVPMVLAMAFVARYFIRGLMAGAVKG